MQMLNLDLVIFDCDGVLVDSELISCSCLAHALRQVGVKIDTQGVIDRFLGLSNAAMVRLVEVEFGVVLPDRFLSDLIQIKQTAFTNQLQAIPDVHLMLQQIRSPVCVASSSHPDLIRHCLTITDLIHFFAPYLFSAVSVQQGKPAPDLFLYAAAEMGVAPDRCLVIEDSDRGVLAGRAAGMTVFGFTGASHVEPIAQSHRLMAAGASAVFADMRSLPALIDESLTLGAE